MILTTTKRENKKVERKIKFMGKNWEAVLYTRDYQVSMGIANL
jgi:hypothetical protein